MEGILGWFCTHANIIRSHTFAFLRYLLFGGKKGHVAVLDCMKLRVGTELQLKEDVYDVQYLQNETMFAVAQNKYVYVFQPHFCYSVYRFSISFVNSQLYIRLQRCRNTLYERS